jgi:hypothetical protein
MEGRKKIVQMVARGMTQYLATVQGMPKEIEEYLDKRIKKFVWEDKARTPMNHDILFLPIQAGGKDLLSIKMRNEAIELKTLQTYLGSDQDRPVWCPLADSTFQKHVRQCPLVEPMARVNPFIQTWGPLIGKLPKPLKRMYQSAKKFGVKFDALAISKDIKESLPMWFHAGATADLKRRNNTNLAKCLRNNHGIVTVGDTLHLIERNYHRHSRRCNCACNSCKSDRQKGCEAPYKCQEEAVKIIDCLSEKWPTFLRQPTKCRTEYERTHQEL